jgi:hypothetical protein
MVNQQKNDSCGENLSDAEIRFSQNQLFEVLISGISVCILSIKNDLPSWIISRKTPVFIWLIKRFT